MKKIAVAAIVGLFAFGAFATAQVYEMTITIKTTVAQSGKISKLCSDLPAGDVISLYRKQSTVKIKGLFWGCDCETIAEPVKVTSPKETAGYIFWNETTKKVIGSDFSWKLLNRIDKKLKKAEGAWVLGDISDDLFLVGGGFGTVKDSLVKGQCALESVILTPMSGNVAGWLNLPEVVVTKGADEFCWKCKAIEGSDDVMAVAPAWSLCACADGFEQTAASGTWKLKYVSGAAKQWNKVQADASITTVYNFPAYVVTYLKSLDGE